MAVIVKREGNAMGTRKLIIQIPCFNEEETLGIALDALPRQVPVPRDIALDQSATSLVTRGADRRMGVARP